MKQYFMIMANVQIVNERKLNWFEFATLNQIVSTMNRDFSLKVDGYENHIFWESLTTDLWGTADKLVQRRILIVDNNVVRLDYQLRKYYLMDVTILPSSDESYTSYWLPVNVAINDRPRNNKDE